MEFLSRLLQLHKIAPAKKLREQAEKFTADNKYKEARSSWKKLVDVADACESCLLGLAQASYDLGDMEAVIEETMYGFECSWTRCFSVALCSYKHTASF